MLGPNGPVGDKAGRGDKPDRPTRILIVVPTLGQRTEFLKRTLSSIADQGVPVDVVLVTPPTAQEARAIGATYGASLLDDPGGLSAAINLGMSQAEAEHEFVNWLGDDDTLAEDSLLAVCSALDRDPRASAAFGRCLYVDEHDNPLWVSQAGRAAPRVITWGPNLVPQPGMLIRREAWLAVGGLDTTLKYTMDLDLLLRLKRWGPLVSVPRIVSTFRWHVESLTVAERDASLAESEAVKRRYLPGVAAALAPAWEGPVRWATKRAAANVTKRANPT